MSNSIDISKESTYTSIFSKCNTDCEIIDLCEFYLYKTPRGKDSPLSLKLDSTLTDMQKEELYNKLLDSANIHKEDFLFSSLLRNKINDIRALRLSDLTLKFDRTKGFFHQNNPGKKEERSQHKLDALLKHIRNAFAHGRIGFIDEFIIIEDKKNELTARMIVSISVLSTWKSVIEDYIACISET